MMGRSWMGSERFRWVGNSDDTIIVTRSGPIHTGRMV